MATEPAVLQTLTADLIAAYFAVFRALRHHHRYDVPNYVDALHREVLRHGQAVRTPTGMTPFDLIVAEQAGLTVVKTRRLSENHIAPVQLGLSAAGLSLGFVVTFGTATPEFRRCTGVHSASTRPEDA